MTSGEQSGEQVASRVGQTKMPCGVHTWPRAGIDQHRCVLPGFGEQQVHRVAAHQHGPFQIGDAPSRQVPLQAVGEVRSDPGHRARCAGLGLRVVAARSQGYRARGEEGGKAALVLPEDASYHAGFCFEEASLLDKPDLHFSRGPFGKLHVRFGKGTHTSGPRPRWVPMLDGLDLVLRWFLEGVRPKFPDSPVLFADESGGSLHRGTIRNRLRYLMELEGRPTADRFSPHALRRACATHNYERGVDRVAIQQMLGHWTASSTMRYVRPSATFIEDAYQRAVASTLAELSGKDTTA